ncbi:hypothetical protein [Paraflavitalea sp. CAU 1676]|uniref:hypothetical protein n=1 Tax=Paraflavitalea sp. CAU 1676 TaxID=3032598 RepID=UPI0023DA8396|nr:hypothetical protein [Paraflavitalea sp. CAU 1676]MDF2188960.1 hypothetical protein [Paraflavitalea sp. CAU 1676]
MTDNKYKEGVTEMDKFDLEILRLLTTGQDDLEASVIIELFRKDFTQKDCEVRLGTLIIALMPPENPMISPRLRRETLNFILRVSVLLRKTIYDSNKQTDNAA